MCIGKKQWGWAWSIFFISVEKKRGGGKHLSQSILILRLRSSKHQGSQANRQKNQEATGEKLSKYLFPISKYINGNTMQLKRPI